MSDAVPSSAPPSTNGTSVEAPSSSSTGSAAPPAPPSPSSTAATPSKSPLPAAGDAPPAPAAGAAPTGAKTGDAKAGQDDEDVDVGPPSTDEVVDMDVFGQLLEIDDDETHEFSKSLAFDYISQAETTFHEIEDALKAQDLDALSRKGHFLKGSSAALGLQRVQHSCEAMQHFGKRRDAHGEGPEVSEQVAFNRCRTLLKRLRKEQEEAKEWLEAFYQEKA
ncbi:hypothetical protein JCM10212_000038 [Sporobolomyces blumeae]